MEREKVAAKTKTLHWWLHWIGTPASIFAILGGGLLYIAQAEVKPVIAKVDAEVKRLDGVDGQLQNQITEVKMSLDDRLKLLHADLNAFKAQMHEDLKRLATRDHFGYLKSEMDNLKTDVGSLKSDVGSLKSDVRILKTEMSSLKTELNNFKEKLITPQQIRTIMREVLAEQHAR
ncbi:MAG: hypothetical protein OXG62_08300 [Nitrospinae bacterium]|nr:hypothetical protein [Nitrospinota bacterium]